MDLRGKIGEYIIIWIKKNMEWFE